MGLDARIPSWRLDELARHRRPVTGWWQPGTPSRYEINFNFGGWALRTWSGDRIEIVVWEDVSYVLDDWVKYELAFRGVFQACLQPDGAGLDFTATTWREAPAWMRAQLWPEESELDPDHTIFLLGDSSFVVADALDIVARRRRREWCVAHHDLAAGRIVLRVIDEGLLQLPPEVWTLELQGVVACDLGPDAAGTMLWVRALESDLFLIANETTQWLVRAASAVGDRIR